MSALSYTECEIDRGAVATAITTFDELHAKISGRSGEYNTITQPVGFDFSGLIGEGLRSAAEENHFSWSSAMMACYHASGVLSKINEDVQWYEDKIEEIKGNLSTALANNAEPDNLNIVQQIVDSHNLDAERAWRDLETRCDESEENLRGGPTPENIRALAEGGHLGEYGLIAFYATENLDYFHVDENQAETIAIHIENAVLHGHDGSIEALEGNPEYLALIGNVVARALTAQQNGDQLLDGEIEFLETLFGDLSAVGSDDPGFLSFIDQVNSSEHISDSLREDLNRNLSNSMLVLSDENIGGGMDKLPEDVQGAVVGPRYDTLDFVYEFNNWVEDFTVLGDFLSCSGPGVQGGTEFSTSLLATSSQMLTYADLESADMTHISQDVFSEIIEVATRNAEANHIILTGENFEGEEYGHHDNHVETDPEKVLQNFYTFAWNDDGSAVAGLTDWISDYQQSSDEERAKIGNEAFVGFFDMVTGDSLMEHLLGTGNSTSGVSGDGESVLWHDVSMGHLNPEIANSLASIFIANIDYFADDQGLGDNPAPGSGSAGGDQASIWLDEDHPLWSEGVDNERAWLNAEDRLTFVQYIMGSEDAAERIYGEVVNYEVNELENFVFNDSEKSSLGALNSGSLRGLVDVALENEAKNRTDNHNEIIAYQDRVQSGVVDTLGGAAGDKNVSGWAVEVFKFFAKEGLSSPLVEEVERVDGNDGSWEINRQLQRMALASIAANDPEALAILEQSHGGVVSGEGGMPVPMEWENWNVSGELRSSVLEDAVDAVKDFSLPGSENTVTHDLGGYGRAYNDNRSLWSDV
ncbi:hypothetical protein [Nocardiopsis tropica]|uniref:TPR repeat domain-containing protein n=1 Tax=Nocardiopsis tropica TaxID=109330 RepID=A0ABU7KJC5_9ACTN|nr:hypothetical protein [Nocardiopsis umidischolae]MEE2049382.1 hypothetical protein [Nocardiopsis umidischolae]